MFTQGKYIVGEIKTNHMPVHGAVCFPEFCDHAVIARDCMVPGSVTGAGFFTVGEGERRGDIVINVHGKSVSLGVQSNPEIDIRQIEIALGLNP